MRYTLGWKQILKLRQRILMEMVYLGRSEVCYLPQPGGRCFNTACLGEWIEGRELCAGDDYEGFQKIVYKGTLGKFLFTLFCHIIKNSYHLKWRNLLAADQWRLKWIFIFFPVLAQQHFHWLFFEMSNFWFRIFDMLMYFKKNTNLCWCDFPFVF